MPRRDQSGPGHRGAPGTSGGSGRQARTRVLFVVENLSVPTDDRVWRESCALRDLGCDVVVCCPQGRGAEAAAHEWRDGVEIHRFPGVPEGTGAGALGREYLNAMVRILRKVWQLDRRRPIDVVHVANPPDCLAIIAASLRLRHDVRIVYDQHDLVPELVETRFAGRRGLRRLAVALERASMALADEVVVANETFATRASSLRRVSPDRVSVVRNAPDRETFARVERDESLKRGKAHLVAYVGVMGPQDGAEIAVLAMAHLVGACGRSDVHAVFVGDGSELPACRRLAEALDVATAVEFVGWQDRRDVLRYLSAADVALVPDPRSPLNDRSSMIKVIEYMTLGVPFVAFDLPETVRTARGAGRIVPGSHPADLARALDALLDDPAARSLMAQRGVERAQGPLGWDAARSNLERAYARLGVVGAEQSA